MCMLMVGKEQVTLSKVVIVENCIFLHKYVLF